MFGGHAIPVIALLWTVLMVSVNADDLEDAKSTVCKVCSTTVTVYKVQKKSTISFTDFPTYPASDGPITYVEKGSVTVKQPGMTTTVTQNYTIFDTDYPYYFQTRTFTTHIPSETTTTVCKRTVTPADYPTPQYCNCKSTPTTTIYKPISIGTIHVVYTYNSTRTRQPTSYGHTATTTDDFSVDTYVPSIYYVDFTKTVYTKTCTKTLAPYQTPANFSTFKLEAVNNPYIGSPSYLYQAINLCINPPFCSERGDYIFSSYPSSDATLWRIVNNTLHDATNNLSCGFSAPGQYNGLAIDCTPGDATIGPVSNLEIDCFGNLRSYQGEADTWGLGTGIGNPVLFPRPDPVHGYNDSGDSYYVQSPEYVDLRVVLD